MQEKQAVISELKSAVKNFDREAAVEAAKKALKIRIDPIEAIEKGLTKGMREVGDLFGKGELFITHLIAAAEAMSSAIKVLEPEILARKAKRKVLGRVVIGTVAGDIHDIGKNLVATLLTAAGFEVHDVGKDAPVERFIEKAKEVEANVIGASTLMTVTAPAQKELADAIAKSGLKAKLVYIVGGAAVRPQWAEEIGAVYAPDANSAVKVIKSLLEARK
jgi:trimethylamine corrinoid protein